MSCLNIPLKARPLVCLLLTGPMSWKSRTGGLLLHSKASSVVSKCREFGSVKGQHLATIGADDKTTPWNTSSAEHETTPVSATAPPESGDISSDTRPKASIDRGVLINRFGQLKVVSRKKAEKDCPTVLILSAASTYLIRDDFTRLITEDDCTIEDGFQGRLSCPKRK